jgi:hypothetical protein
MGTDPGDGFKRQTRKPWQSWRHVILSHILVATYFSALLLQSKVVKSEVTLFTLGGHAEIVSECRPHLPGDQTPRWMRTDGLFDGKGSKSLGPVRLVGKPGKLSQTDPPLNIV